jgi:serine/threonine protein kinase/tetratricopeptide (TPR) repeat protein
MTERTIFLAALGYDLPEERSAYLDEVCSGDPELRHRIEDMLEVHKETAPAPADPGDGPLELPALEAWKGDASAPARPLEGPGAFIGPYRLLEVIGEGGLGIVYRAEHELPTARQVAVKIIKPRLDSEEITARFEAERQGLGLLDHPNIARIHDVGATESERLYFVTELVEGVPLPEYCRQQQLPLRQRLELFLPVCQAIQHAHHKGIVHRNLKPSNVVVTSENGQPVPRVLDFGITQGLDSPLIERLLLAHLGQGLGSPEYLSPEQAETDGGDIDTRSDIYSLGVLLYELLTDTPPLEPQRLREASLVQVQRWIREEPPVRPSQRTSGLPARLDEIVLKALDKDRCRRHETPTVLAQDVERYLRGEAFPRQPLAVRRRAPHRVPSLVATACLLLLIVVFTVYQAVRARRAESAAREECASAWAAEQKARTECQRLADLEEEARADRDQLLAAQGQTRSELALANDARKQLERELNRALREVGVSRAVADFLATDVMGQPDSLQQSDRDVKLRTVLDQGVVQLPGKTEGQPLVEAALRDTIGRAYLALGLLAEARPQLEQGVALYRKELGEAHQQTLLARTHLIQLDQAQGQTEQAELALLEVLRQARGRLGAEHPLTLATMTSLAQLYEKQGKLADSETLFTRVLEASRHARGEESPEALAALHNLASVYSSEEKYAQAEEMFEQVLEKRSRLLGGEDPRTLATMNSLAAVYQNEGKHAEAEQTWKRVLETHRRLLGPEHPGTLTVMHNLAEHYLRVHQPERAEALLARVVERGRRALSFDHPRLFQAMTMLARLYQAGKKFEKAEDLLRSACRSLESEPRAVLAGSRERLEEIHQQLVQLYDAWGKKDEAARWRKNLASLRGSSEPGSLAPSAEGVESVGREEPAEPMDP